MTDAHKYFSTDISEKQAHMQSTALLTALQSQPPRSTKQQSPAQQ
jgi:hypothetical protein